MSLFENRKKKKAIGFFLSNLPEDLKRRYGAKESYTPGQIESTLNQKGYPQKYQDYALASFLKEEEAIQKLGSSDLVHSLREEIAARFFNGDLNYVSGLANRRRVGNEAHCSGSFVDD